MRLLSCSNCCFNPLQYDTIGLTIGYCAKHQLVLRQADFTTCGDHLRKDLGIAAAEAAAAHHERIFKVDAITDLKGSPVNGGYLESNVTILRGDSVGVAVADYGFLPTKVASLVQIKGIPGGRAELAMLSLSRTYVRRCVAGGGLWTSGLHLIWWTQERLDSEPLLAPADFRLQSFSTLARQIELAQWSIVMLRFTFLSDVAVYASRASEEMGQFENIVEDAADSAGTSLRKLLRFAKGVAIPRLQRVLPETRYRQMAANLHKD